MLLKTRKAAIECLNRFQEIKVQTIETSSIVKFQSGGNPPYRKADSRLVRTRGAANPRFCFSKIPLAYRRVGCQKPGRRARKHKNRTSYISCLCLGFATLTAAFLSNPRAASKIDSAIAPHPRRIPAKSARCSEIPLRSRSASSRSAR